MKNRRSIQILFNRQVIIFIVIAFLSACTQKYISDYDESTDNSVTSLQRKFERFFVTLDELVERDKCVYTYHISFYQDSKVDISSVQVRAKALTKNEKTVEQISLLSDSLTSLEKLHKLGCISTEQIESLRSSFNSSYTAILKLELAKKRTQ